MSGSTKRFIFGSGGAVIATMRNSIAPSSSSKSLLLLVSTMKTTTLTRRIGTSAISEMIISLRNSNKRYGLLPLNRTATTSTTANTDNKENTTTTTTTTTNNNNNNKESISNNDTTTPKPPPSEELLTLSAPTPATRRVHTVPTDPVHPKPVIRAWNQPPLPEENFRPLNLPRNPDLTTLGILKGVDLIFSTSIFSIGGALTAATSGCDLFGCILVGAISAVGGGTIRDAIVVNKAPFWVAEWEYLIVAAVAAMMTFFFWGQLTPGAEYFLGFRVESSTKGLQEYPLIRGTIKSETGGQGTLMQWADAIALGTYNVIGTMVAIRAHAPPLIVALAGMMTCTFGLVFRDVILNQPVRIMHPYADLYAPITIVGSTVYLALRAIIPRAHSLRVIGVIGLVVFLRYEAWTNGWRLPYWALDLAENPLRAAYEGATVMYSNYDPRMVWYRSMNSFDEEEEVEEEVVEAGKEKEKDNDWYATWYDEMAAEEEKESLIQRIMEGKWKDKEKEGAVATKVTAQGASSSSPAVTKTS